MQNKQTEKVIERFENVGQMRRQNKMMRLQKEPGRTWETISKTFWLMLSSKDNYSAPSYSTEVSKVDEDKSIGLRKTLTTEFKDGRRCEAISSRCRDETMSCLEQTHRKFVF